MPFRKKIKIYFDQGDPAHIAFHGQHTIIAQRVMESYVQEIGIDWKDWYDNKEYFMPVVRHDIHFIKPLYPGREYFVEVRFVKLGHSSLTVNYKIVSPKEELCCRILAVYVCASAKKFKACAFPKDLRKVIEKNLEEPEEF